MAIVSQDVAGMAASIVSSLEERKLTLGTAESLTGGELASTIVSVPGASSVFRGGIVSYAPDVKTSVLGVSADLIHAEGTVHPDVARQMAQGARRLLNADIALATTGVAGPGPAEGHPAGTVFVACATEERTVVRECALAGPRPQVRAEATAQALDLLLHEMIDRAGFGSAGAHY